MLESGNEAMRLENEALRAENEDLRRQLASTNALVRDLASQPCGPNAAFILGVAAAGGDPIAAAHQIAARGFEAAALTGKLA